MTFRTVPVKAINIINWKIDLRAMLESIDAQDAPALPEMPPGFAPMRVYLQKMLDELSAVEITDPYAAEHAEYRENLARQKENV